MNARPSDCDAVLSALRERPYARRELCAALGIRDNATRCAIEELRARGELVIHDGEQYKIAASFEEYAEWRASSPLARAHRLLEQVRRMDERAARTWPQQLTLEAA